jgi:hypothetical protein
MRVVVLQPSYLPWLGYFDQIDRADVFVFYDDVQYDKNGWRNRNRIKTPQGWAWITVPVLTRERFGAAINEVEIDNRAPWARKHLKTLSQNYSRSPYYGEYIGLFEDIYFREWEKIADLNMALIKAITGALGTDVRFACSSELNLQGDRLGRLVEICLEFGADRYLTGDSARDYMDRKVFSARGIQVEYQNYRHPVYPQLYGEFISHLSIVDLLFNCGPESLSIIARGRT